MTNPTDDQIRLRAHELWEIAGRPDGREREFWYEAERELKGGSASPKSPAGTVNPDEKSTTFLE